MNEFHEHIDERNRSNHKYWAEKTSDQWIFATNFFFVMAIGILGFILSEIEKDKSVAFALAEIDWRITCSRFSAVLALFSIISGALAMLARLHDFRLNRHMEKTRIRAYTEEYDFKILQHDSRGFEHLFMFKTLVTAIFTKDYLILKEKEKNIFENNEDLQLKFNNLRQRTQVLARLSRRSFHVQLALLIAAVIIFIIGWIS